MEAVVLIITVVVVALLVVSWARTIKYHGLVPPNRTTGALGVIGGILSLGLAAQKLFDDGATLSFAMQLFLGLFLLVLSVPYILRPAGSRPG